MDQEEVGGVGVTFSASAGDVAVVKMVVVWGWSNVPPVNTVNFPCYALLRILVDKDAHAQRGDWRAVEIKGAVELGVYRQSKIYAR